MAFPAALFAYMKEYDNVNIKLNIQLKTAPKVRANFCFNQVISQI
jgi:hypothetical protein